MNKLAGKRKNYNISPNRQMAALTGHVVQSSAAHVTSSSMFARTLRISSSCMRVNECVSFHFSKTEPNYHQSPNLFVTFYKFTPQRCGYDHFRLRVVEFHNSTMQQQWLQSVRPGRRSLVDWPMKRLVISSLLVTLIPNLFSRCQAVQLPDIYWNSSNPIFQIGTQQPVLKVRIGDRLNIVCPYYPSPTVHADKFEYMEIYGVTRKSYEECTLNDRATIVGVCNTPTVPTVLTMVIREFTPNPSGLEFKPGRKYYFISTSTGSRAGLANRNGGLCSKNKMKMMFDVRRSDAQAKIKTGEYFFITYHTPGMIGQDYQEDAEEHLLMNEKEEEEEDTAEPIVEENVDWAIEAETTTTPLLYIIHTRPYDEISASWYNRDKFGNSHLQYIDTSSNNKASLTVQLLVLAILLLFHYRDR
ncbi:Ephrin-B2 [Trichinella pseudospiralis]|uniref:Ephrin-B2 n=1 Tax=Trichinella pseudospiralis TaxID=6337 RepID=A0A0V1FA17_TRIPS|nr:Ephrin-B2 [Trichinella pseudospiralis]